MCLIAGASDAPPSVSPMPHGATRVLSRGGTGDVEGDDPMDVRLH
jgi:hypothetical protein